MAMRMQDIGELAYGGLVEATAWWDRKRVDEGTITEKEMLKKFSTWAYVVPGGLATIFSAFGVWRGMELWNEHLSHGFIYGFPGFIVKIVDAVREGGASSSAVQEAQRILREKSAERQLVAGRGTGRSYQSEFEKATAW